MRYFRHALLIVLSVSVVACGDDNKNETFVEDSARPMDESRYAFVPDKQVIKFDSISRAERRELMNCEEKSTHERLDREAYTISVSRLERVNARSLDFLKEEKNIYQTENEGEVYEITTSVLQNTMNGESALAEGPYSYKDSCSSEKGCDAEARVYLKGSAKEIIASAQKESLMAIRSFVGQGSGLGIGNIYCEIEDVEESEKSLVMGSISIGGKSYKAAQIITTTDGSVYCKARSISPLTKDGRLFMGKGQKTSKDIVLRDELAFPKGSIEFPGLEYSREMGCRRTRVFESNKMVQGGDILEASSTEMVDYNLIGKLPTEREMDNKKKELNKSYESLQADIDNKNTALDNEREKVVTLRQRLRESNRKLVDAKVTLTEEEQNVAAAITGKDKVEIAAAQKVHDKVEAEVAFLETEIASLPREIQASRDLIQVLRIQVRTASESYLDFVDKNGPKK